MTSHPLSDEFQRLRPQLHRYCARMLGSSLDGEDIVQEALLRALQSPLPEPLDNPGGWLFRIAHNLALDALRRRARQDAGPVEDDMDTLPDPVDVQARRDATAASLPAFMQLPAAQRSAVILFDVLEYSAEEIAAMLETTVPSVKSALQRGRARLRALAVASAPMASLPEAETRLLRQYVALFNARDFDAVRDMLTADVRLDLVNRLQLQGHAVGQYYGRYGQAQGWKAVAGVAEGRPALLMQQPGGVEGSLDYVIVLECSGERIAGIRDFLFAQYAMDGMACRPL